MAYIELDSEKHKKYETHTFYGNRHTLALLEPRLSLSKPPNSTIGPHLTINYESLYDDSSKEEEIKSAYENQ